MHDVSRDSFLRKQWDEKKRRHQQHHPHEHDEHLHADHHHEERADGHSHSHHPDIFHDHEHDDAHDHSHNHGEMHAHQHPHHNEIDAHDFHHAHEHRHVFYHSHGHQHDRVRSTLVHRVLKDPVRDWFGVGIICCLLLLAMSGTLPIVASKGCLLAAAVIGLFPAVKNAVLSSCIEKRVSVELFAALLIISILASGHFFAGALAALFLLLGSFLHLDFSWGEH